MIVYLCVQNHERTKNRYKYKFFLPNKLCAAVGVCCINMERRRRNATKYSDGECCAVLGHFNSNNRSRQRDLQPYLKIFVCPVKLLILLFIRAWHNFSAETTNFNPKMIADRILRKKPTICQIDRILSSIHVSSIIVCSLPMSFNWLNSVKYS